jgi:sugar lactone lactonase YvrE
MKEERTMKHGIGVLGWVAAGAVALGAANAPTLTQEAKTAPPELVATFSGPMPTGVTVSQGGRIFVNFPRWGDPVTATVAEVVDGQPRAFPPGLPQGADPKQGAGGLVSVQSVVVDPADRLWILDTGSVKFGPTSPGGPKLVGVDLKTNKVFKTITFPREVAHQTSYLNDVRFDLRRGKAGLAYITDSAMKGANGIVVVDLATGKSWRRLNDHPSTKAVPNFVPIVEGQALLQRKPGEKPKPITIGSDGIAISSDGETLFYCPLASRRLYSVSVDALSDPALPANRAAATVKDLGDKGASDGLESDAKGRVYLTEYEHNAVLRRMPDGSFETLVHDPRALWPDTLSVAKNGYLYFTANQLHRQADYHNGKDLRVKPYALFRVKIDAGPVLLK